MNITVFNTYSSFVIHIRTIYKMKKKSYFIILLKLKNIYYFIFYLYLNNNVFTFFDI